jgi:hypothetical protein
MCNAAQTRGGDPVTLARMTQQSSTTAAHRVGVAVIALLVGAHAASAQDLSRYRGYVLGNTVDSVLATSGARPADVRTLHERPAKIQELEWRAPYLSSRREPADPIGDIVFTFFNDSLYQVVVSYDRDRTDGLTNDDIIGSLSGAYGMPVLTSERARTIGTVALHADTTVLAQWETAASALTLVRATYAPEFRVILVAKAVSARARSAMRDAVKLDVAEAPQREADRRDKEAADASAARDKARLTNKPAFRP